MADDEIRTLPDNMLHQWNFNETSTEKTQEKSGPQTLFKGMSLLWKIIETLSSLH